MLNRKTILKPVLLLVIPLLLAGCVVEDRAVYQPQPAQVYQPAPAPVVVTEQPAYVQPAPVYVEPAPAPDAVLEINAVSDFYEPLNAYGRWIVVQGYGRCWVPAGVDQDWRPYTEGHWQRTDAGWYWVSDERWGWATCHYGRWYQDPDNGWVWVPQTQWAPAWVAWREGGGYAGWAPLPPEARIGVNGGLEYREGTIDPHAFVFVEEGRMLEPQHHQTVIVNNTTIINNTVNITKIQVVNKTVINEGPRPEVIAQASGRKVEVVAARGLRTRQEAAVVIAHRKNAPTTEKKVQPVVLNNAESAQKKETMAEPTEPLPMKPKAEEPNVVTSNEKTVSGEVKKSLPNEEFRPVPKPDEVVKTAGQPVKPGAEPDKAPKPAVQAEVNPERKPQTEQGTVVKQPAQPAQTPEQKLAQEKKREADEKRLEKEKSGSSANAQLKAQQ
jgi:hypothetical protein